MTNKITGVFSKIGQFVKEVNLELKKVSWSTKEELKGSTIIVIIAIFVLGAFIGAFDFIMSKLVDLVIK